MVRCLRSLPQKGTMRSIARIIQPGSAIPWSIFPKAGQCKWRQRRDNLTLCHGIRGGHEGVLSRHVEAYTVEDRIKIASKCRLHGFLPAKHTGAASGLRGEVCFLEAGWGFLWEALCWVVEQKVVKIIATWWLCGFNVWLSHGNANRLV